MSERIAVPTMAGCTENPASGRVPSRATLRSLSFVAALFVMGACGDSATAPGRESVDRAAVSLVIPSVVDARTRLAPSIENAVVRDRVVFDIQALETALLAGDAQSARFHVRVTGNLLNEYMSGRSLSLKEGPDVSGVALMLFKVSGVVNAGYELKNLP